MPREGEEWGGQTSSKFLPTKKHVEPKYSIDPQYKQMFDSKGRKHFEQPKSGEQEWKPSIKQIDFNQIHEVKRPGGKALVEKGKFR